MHRSIRSLHKPLTEIRLFPAAQHTSFCRKVSKSGPQVLSRSRNFCNYLLARDLSLFEILQLLFAFPILPIAENFYCISSCLLDSPNNFIRSI